MREISSPLAGFASPFGPQRGFNPLRLFANDEPGVWFEANDANTLFTDVAGTTPVTAPGDAVALQLDKSQGLTLGPDTVDFAVLGDQGTGWVKEDGIIKKISDDATLYDFGASVEAGKYYEITLTKLNHTVGNPSITVGGNSYSGIISFEDPDGTYTFILQATGSGTVTVAANAARIWLSAFSVRELPGNHRTQATTAARPLYALHPVGGVRNELVSTDTLATQDVTVTAAQRTLSFKGTGTVTLSGASTAGPLVGTGAEDIVSLTFTPTAGTLTLTVTGTVEEAQLELGAARTNYQTVGSSFLDVSEEGKARRGRIWYNGTSHFMETGTITPGTDKVQVFAGVRKLRNNAQEAVLELNNFAEAGLSVQTLATFAPWRFGSRGDAAPSIADAASSTFPSPVSSIITGLGDISGDSAILRVDGVEIAESTADQGLGNYANSVLRFGARAGISLFFNGYEDTSIIRFGPNLDASVIGKVESYVASKTPEATI